MLTQAQEIALMVMVWMYFAMSPVLALMAWFREPKRIPDHLMSMAVNAGFWITLSWVAMCLFWRQQALHVAWEVFYLPARLVRMAGL